MPGAVEGREEGHVAQPGVPRGQGSADRTSLTSRGFGWWENAQSSPAVKAEPLEWEEPALGNGQRWRESFMESWRGGGSLFTEEWPAELCRGRSCHLICTSASAFDRSSVLVKTKRWAVTFTLEKRLHLRKFELEGDSRGSSEQWPRDTPPRPHSLSASIVFVDADQGKR